MLFDSLVSLESVFNKDQTINTIIYLNLIEDFIFLIFFSMNIQLKQWNNFIKSSKVKTKTIFMLVILYKKLLYTYYWIQNRLLFE